MEPQDKKEEKKEEKKEQSNQAQASNTTGKLQRKLKFKTLDGNIKNLECDYDIKISELKKKLAEIYKIEPIRQRLLNKGKQFKDDEYLDKLVDKDDTTIHLVFRSEEDARRLQENAKNNTPNQNQTQAQTQNNQNTNPFQNILSVVNSDQIRSLTNNIVNQLLSGQNSNANSNTTNNNTNSNTNNTNTHTINLGNVQYRTLNVGETLNLANSPLHPINSSSTNPTPLNLNNDNSNQNANNAASVPNQNSNNYSSQFPITPSVTDKKYDVHLKKIEKELNEADEIISKKIEPRIPLPLLNTTQNVFTAISRSIRKYVIVNQNILCHLMRLADLMEREQFITDSNVRMTGNKLLDQAYKSLLHVSNASKDLSNIIKSSNFSNAPNSGYIGIVCQEIGLQSANIEVGDLNAENLLAALGGSNNRNNANGNSNNNQGSNNNPDINATIVEVSVDPNGNYNINNVNTTASVPTTTNIQNNSNTNANTNTNNKENDKKEENAKKDEEKSKENTNVNDKKEANNTNTTNNIAQNTQNTQNNARAPANNNNDFNNLFGNIMNQLMTPDNLNSMAGAMDSMLNQGQNQSGSGGNSQGMGGLFGNLLSNLMGSLGDDSDEEEEKKETPEVNTQPKEQPKTQTQTQEDNKVDNKDNKETNKNLLIKKLVENSQLRRDTKISEESKIGEKMEPNIEFENFSNEIVSNLTVEEVFSMNNLHFNGLCRLRKDIQKKYFGDKTKNDEIIKNVIELLCERLILIENQIDKLKQNKELNIEEFLNKNLKEVLNMFIDDSEVNKSDSEWEEKFRKLIITMLQNLIKELKEVYETGEDGAKTFLEFNILTLIENFIGQKYLALIQDYNDDIINSFVENVFTLLKAEEIKSSSNQPKDDSNKKSESEERPTLLSIEEIFKIATKDKDRLEKEEKEPKDDKDKKYSEFYYLTSLFKN